MSQPGRLTVVVAVLLFSAVLFLVADLDGDLVASWDEVARYSTNPVGHDAVLSAAVQQGIVDPSIVRAMIAVEEDPEAWVEHIADGNMYVIEVRSRSMEPTLKVGDLLVVEGGLGAEDIFANPGDGDIIAFGDPRNLGSSIPIVHRAIDKFQDKGKWYFRTKGDNNPHPDSLPVPEDYLLGKVTKTISLS